MMNVAIATPLFPAGQGGGNDGQHRSGGGRK